MNHLTDRIANEDSQASRCPKKDDQRSVSGVSGISEGVSLWIGLSEKEKGASDLSDTPLADLIRAGLRVPSYRDQAGV